MDSSSIVSHVKNIDRDPGGLSTPERTRLPQESRQRNDGANGSKFRLGDSERDMEKRSGSLHVAIVVASRRTRCQRLAKCPNDPRDPRHTMPPTRSGPSTREKLGIRQVVHSGREESAAV